MNKGIEPDLKKVEAISEMPVPKNEKRALQTCSWHRRSIETFADISYPKLNLPKRDSV